MSDLLQPGLGSKMSISSTLPNDQLLATYQALSWVDVGHLEDVPEYGPAHDVVTFVDLETGNTAKYHGALNNGSLTIPVGYDVDDAGQEDLIDALGARTRIAFRIQRPDGSADFFQGKVMSATQMANIGSVITRNINIEIETPLTTGAGAPPPPPPPPG